MPLSTLFKDAQYIINGISENLRLKADYISAVLDASLDGAEIV